MPRSRDLRQLPKVELHRHLDGSIRLSIILELAEENGLDVGARTVSGLRRIATVRRAVQRLRDEDVLLEVSPTSNWLTRSVPSLDAHPLPLLYRAGVPACINSDHPDLMDIDLVHEYGLCRKRSGTPSSPVRRRKKR